MKMRALIMTAAATLSLTGCVGVEPAQPVASEAQAIRIAKERCTWTRPFDANEQWHARLRDGQWHVWLVRDRDPREPVVGTLDIWIRAKDGDAGSCNRAP